MTRERYLALDRIKVLAYWPMLEDVVIRDDYTAPSTYIGMSLEQAKQLVTDLERAIQQTETMINDYAASFENEERKSDESNV